MTNSFLTGHILYMLRDTLVHEIHAEQSKGPKHLKGFFGALYIIVWESTTVSNSGLCTRVHNTIGCIVLHGMS